jgi:outer membrane protein TolC
LSDVELLKNEAEYEEVRRRRLVSEQRQRLTRSRLALAMGRPGELVSELESPQIELPAAAQSDFETFWSEVEKGAPRLQALQMRLDAAAQNLSAARASESPVLSAELGASVYNRNTSSTHPLGGGLVLEVPLYSGGGKDAAIMRAQAELTSAKAELLDARLQLRQEALQAWLDRDRLRSDLQTVRAVGDYRDLYLDRSRALYELEVRTDLGDAMSQISEVRLRRARILFDWAMNEARLRAMTGSLLEDKQ